MSQWRPRLKEIAQKPDPLSPGHRLCAGCGASIVANLALRSSDRPIIAVNATGCLEVATTIFPYTSWNVPWIHVAFENAGAVASGVESALRVLKRKHRVKSGDVDVIAFGGDGGTYDIGLQALSGAIERGHDFLYVLYDNEAYMNTGIQRSGGTPRGASTTTTPAGSVVPGNIGDKKPIADIITAHGTQYVATATPKYWGDLMTKVHKGLEVEGPAFIHALAPCPRGWRHESDATIELSELAVETCFFPLWEAEEGVYKLTSRSGIIARKPDLKKPIEAYLEKQGRFAHLFTPENRHVIDDVQQNLDQSWHQLLMRCGAE